jgi:hypothetical protein
MEPETTKHLLGAIRKWKRIKAKKDADHGSRNCPLCQRFSRMCKHPDTGEQCPVDIATNGRGCDRTPYQVWVNHQNKAHTRKEFANHCPECEELADAMILFLEKLRPNYGRKKPGRK